MKFYKTILVLGLVVGDYSVSGCDLRTQQEFEKFACLVGTAKPVATVFTNGLNKCIRLSSCNV